MLRTIITLAALLSLATPIHARADSIDGQLTRLEVVAQQWWAGYGLTTDMGYATPGTSYMPGCGASVRILRGYSDGLGDVMYPHGCDIRLNESLVRAAFGAPRNYFIQAQIRSAGLRPRGRYAARELLCAVMIHETGHILGLSHAPTGIMRDGAPAPPQACVVWARR
jgi:hypothetical protein